MDSANISLLKVLLCSLKLRVNNMCKKLNELNGQQAEDLLSLLGKDFSIPIDIEKILDCLSIEYKNYDFSDFETKLPIGEKILGAALVDKDDVIILYRDGESKNRKRFTLAHEIAHCCLDAQNLKDGHIEFRSDQISNNSREYEANVFAGKLLIPKENLLQEYRHMIAPLSDVLAKTFGVSTNVMEKRLEYLKLPYYKPIIPDD